MSAMYAPSHQHMLYLRTCNVVEFVDAGACTQLCLALRPCDGYNGVGQFFDVGLSGTVIRALTTV